MDSTLYQLLILFLLFYLFLIRPEMKKAKKHQAMLNALKKDDKIITRGGIYGVITKVTNNDDLLVKIADNVEITLSKSGVWELADNTLETASSSIPNQKKTTSKAKNKGK